MEKSLYNITFTSFPPVSDSVKLQEPYYWYDLELHYPYVVINDYEKKKADGLSEHFLLIVNKEHKLQEIPVRDNFKINFIN